MKEKENKTKLNKTELSWVLYDVGNSAFTMLACSLITIWFKALATPVIGADKATGYWALSASIVTIIVAFIGPICGTIADNKGFKKPVFTTALIIGVALCFALGFINSWVLFLVVFVITKTAYASSLVFYDSMLTDITTPDRMDVVSSFGFAWGYIGSCAPFLICLIAYVGDYMFGIISPELARIIGFTVTAIWWFAVSVPLLKNYKQIYYVEPQKGAIRDCFSRLGTTIKSIVTKDKKIMYFLIAFFLYIDGVDTIIDNAINIGTDLNLDTVGQVVFLLATQVVAFAFSLLFSKLSKKYKTEQLIQVCIAGYFCVSVYAMFLSTLLQFGIMAFMVGMFQGSIQALSRSYYGKIIPAENSGEYFGLYDIFSKGAAFLGSALISAIKFLGFSINIAVGSLAVFFISGFFLFRKAAALPNRNEN